MFPWLSDLDLDKDVESAFCVGMKETLMGLEKSSRMVASALYPYECQAWADTSASKLGLTTT